MRFGPYRLRGVQRKNKRERSENKIKRKMERMKEDLLHGVKDKFRVFLGQKKQNLLHPGGPTLGEGTNSNVSSSELHFLQKFLIVFLKEK